MIENLKQVQNDRWGSFHGYTLIELAIAMAITLFAILVITRFFITEHYIYTVQEAEAEAYQTLRGAMNMLSNELMLTGYGLPPEIRWITKFEDDEIEFRTNLRNITSYLSSEAYPGQTNLDVRPGTGAFFEKGDIIIICRDSVTDRCEEHTISEDGSSNSITVLSGLGNTFPLNSRIDLINTISYRYNRSKGELQRKIDNGNWVSVAENLAEDGLLLYYRDKDNNTPADSKDIRCIDINLALKGIRRVSGTAAIALRNYL